jgi:UDP-2,4-diacetamido-2,4,6-trideoxy-beta-L-altropyranose hydrolase
MAPYMMGPLQDSPLTSVAKPDIKQRAGRFVFYANASPAIGAGHIMRLFAIAQECVLHGIQVCFASHECPEHLRAALQQAGCEYVLLPANFTQADIANLRANVLVIDDYNAQQQQWQYFVDSGAVLVNIDDDTHQQPLLSDIIINPDAGAQQQAYKKRAPNAVFCLGPQFALLRQEFVQQAFLETSKRKHILITLGGADVKNMSYSLALSLLKRVSTDTHIQVLLGGLVNNSAADLHKLSQQHHNLEIIEHSQNVAEIMMRAGLAISTAGGTLGELASMGTPTIALVSADNQKAALTQGHGNTWYRVFDVREYHDFSDDTEHNTQFNVEGSAKYTAKYREELMDQNTKLIEKVTIQAHELWRDLCTRERMSDQARQLIDGLGCHRILQQILNQL